MKTNILTILLLLVWALPISTQTYKRYHGDGIDNVLQYVPMATCYTLKLVGVEGKNDMKHRLAITLSSMAVNAGVVYALKHTIKRTRPDGTDNHSFPSGHTSIAFCGAMNLHHEYGKVSPWISVGGFTVATIVAVDRIRRNRHHWEDVAAGAAIGVASAKIGQWIGKKLLPQNDKVDVAIAPNALQLVWKL